MIGWAWAIVLGLIVAFLSALENFAFLPQEPFWSAVMLALAASPCGRRLSVDAWLRRNSDPEARLPRYVFSDAVATRVVKAVHGDASGVRGAAWLWNT